MLNHKKTEIHGHRGCRGYYPENTLQGFLHALSLKTNAIEMDVVISRDHKVVISHEHFMHHKKCLWPNLKSISKEDEAKLLLFQMDYSEIKTFDCGLLPHPNYPLVINANACKPLLSELIEQAEIACKAMAREPIIYNIEIKSDASLVGKAQPNYDTFIHLIFEIIHNYKIENRVIVQSFDKEILKAIKIAYPKLVLSLLIEDEIAPMVHIDQLGFLPDILASDYIYLNKQHVEILQSQNIKVFAFTVNQIADIQKMLSFEIDAIITDYPDVAAQCLFTYMYPEK